MGRQVREKLNYGNWNRPVKFNILVILGLFLLVVWFNIYFALSLIIVAVWYLIFRGQPQDIRTRNRDPPI